MFLEFSKKKIYIYILSRKSLDIGYFSFIRPIVEYGDVIYDSCSKADLGKLENVQLEAARIATGCKSHASHKQLYIKLGWMKLSDIRESKKLKKLYCITRFNTPQYLIDTLEEMKTYHSHSTRAASTHTIPMPKCKKEITKVLFPSTIRFWNSLNSQCREARTKSQFSTLINNMYDCKKRLFLYCVSRSTKVAFTQLRVGFCNLNYDLYIKNYVEAGNCECGHIRENSKHYLLQCSNNTSQRNVMLDKVKMITNTKYVRPQHLLNGYEKLNLNENMNIIQAVCDFILSTKRLLIKQISLLL